VVITTLAVSLEKAAGLQPLFLPAWLPLLRLEVSIL